MTLIDEYLILFRKIEVVERDDLYLDIMNLGLSHDGVGTSRILIRETYLF